MITFSTTTTLATTECKQTLKEKHIQPGLIGKSAKGWLPGLLGDNSGEIIQVYHILKATHPRRFSSIFAIKFNNRSKKLFHEENNENGTFSREL